MGNLLHTPYHNSAEAYKIITGNPLIGEQDCKTNIPYMLWIRRHYNWYKRSRKLPSFIPDHYRDDFHSIIYEHAKKRLTYMPD